MWYQCHSGSSSQSFNNFISHQRLCRRNLRKGEWRDSFGWIKPSLQESLNGLGSGKEKVKMLTCRHFDMVGGQNYISCDEISHIYSLCEAILHEREDVPTSIAGHHLRLCHLGLLQMPKADFQRYIWWGKNQQYVRLCPWACVEFSSLLVHPFGWCQQSLEIWSLSLKTVLVRQSKTVQMFS